MSADRLLAVSGLELRGLLRRPMFWTMVAVLALLAWGMSTGSVMLGTGSAVVGGRKAWITSEFSSAFILSVLAASFYSFFVAIAAGLSVTRDQELGVGELLHATRLRPAEYVWGKAAAMAAGFLVAAVLHLGFMVLFNHLLPNPQATQIRGPFHLVSYLRPALLFALPTIVFFGGVAFWLGERFRRPMLAFMLPIGTGLFQFSLLWNWSPSWLAPAWNRLLMIVDPSGFRWLNETWLKLDRGADFYNTAPVGLDSTILVNRALFAGLGLLAVVAARRHFSFGRPQAAAGRRRRRPTAASTAGVALAMSQRPAGFFRHWGEFARAELVALLHHPGLYLFAFFVLIQAMAQTLLATGAFEAPLLLTPGMAAVGAFNTLSLLLCLLLMFFLVESLERERGTGTEPLIYSSPSGSAAYLVGKVTGNSLVAVGVLLASLVGGAVTMLIQGEVAFDITPYLLVWGGLMLPTFFAWCFFLCAVQALTRNRYMTYGLGLGALALTIYRQMTGGMNWVGNWMMWDTVRWSDVSVLELDRRPIVLNRLMVLALAGLFLLVAVRYLQRRRVDATQLVNRLRPKSLLREGYRLAAVAAVPLTVGLVLWVGVLNGIGGETAEREYKDYWKQNHATWREAKQPSMASVDLDVRLEPAAGGIVSRGELELVNPHDEALRRFAITGGRHWRNLAWTLDGEPFEPEDRSGLYVFDRPLEPGEHLRLGYSFNGSYPGGMSKNGGDKGTFVLPGGVVLSGFDPSFMPVLGYREDIGVDDDNRYDPPDYDDDLYRETLEPMLGNRDPFTTRVRIDVPAAYQVHSVGVRESETVAAGRRRSVWVSDHPVRLVNIIAGDWEVRRGDGTAVYYFAEHPYNVDEIARTLDAARKHYSEWFHPFPWRELRVSEFAGLAVYAQGFPTNITFSENIGFLVRDDPKTNLVMMVTAHETAHQWWGNLLTPGDGPGGNILSEGMAHFSTAMLIEELGGQRRREEFAKRTEARYGDRRRPDAERPLVKIDSTQPGDRTVTYDKASMVVWMLMREMDREPLLAGLREFIARFKDGPDYPLLEDLIETLRPHAPDPQRFDRFVEQWFFDVVVPEFRLHDVGLDRAADRWVATTRLENFGTGEVEVAVAAVTGERWSEDGERGEDYRETRVTVALGAGESREVRIEAPFEPERIVVDPDVEVLQLRRNAAVAEL